jgi:hypothetical protein
MVYRFYDYNWKTQVTDFPVLTYYAPGLLAELAFPALNGNQ